MIPPRTLLPLAYGLFALACLPALPYLLAHPDVAWHLAAGDLIRSHGSLPAHDVWSFSAAATPWLNTSWLFDALLSLIHQQHGLQGVVQLTIIMAGLSGVALVVSMQASPLGSLLAMALLALCLPQMLAVSPALFTFAFCALSIALLNRTSSRAHWLLPLIILLWANLHSSFAAGFGVISIFLLEALARRDHIAARHFLLLLLACVAASFFTPYGIHSYDAFLRAWQAGLTDYVLQWQAGRVQLPSFTGLYLLVFIVVCAMQERAVRPAHRLLALVGFLLCLASPRLLYLSLPLSAPYLAQAIPSALAQSPLASYVARADIFFTRLLSSRATVLGAWLGVLLVAALLYCPMVTRHAQFAPQIAPQAALDYVVRHHPHTRFIHPYQFGGYIAYATEGHLPVLLDGRFETAYPDAVVKDYMRIFAPDSVPTKETEPEPSFTELLQRYKAGGMWVASGSAIDRLLVLDPTWHEVYRDEIAAIFIAHGAW